MGGSLMHREFPVNAIADFRLAQFTLHPLSPLH
jgi:hypothetical protein